MIVEKKNELYAFAIGFFSYWSLTGGSGLDPRNVGWLLRSYQSNLDSAQNYLGWEFFRQGSLFHWPIGSTPSLSDGASVALTDSLPLFAIFFKALLFWHDEPFQYFGIWVLTCFLFQAYFSFKILKVFISNQKVALVGTMFFTMAPAFIDRFRTHLPLSGHWIVLAAIFLVCKKRIDVFPWVLLGCVAIGVQPYFYPVVLIFYVALLFFATFQNTSLISTLIKRLLIFFASSLFAAFQFGLFAFGFRGAQAGGYGDYSANPFSLVDSGIQFPFAIGWTWSRYVPSIEKSAYQYEGFAYIGIGCLLLCLVVLISKIANDHNTIRRLGVALLLLVLGSFSTKNMTGVSVCLATILLLVLIYQLPVIHNKTLVFVFSSTSVILLATAFTNRIHLGIIEIDLHLPDALLSLLSTFRSSGRFIWAPMYLVIIFSIVSVSRLTRNSILAVALLISGVLIQWNDSRSATQLTKDKFRYAEYDSPLISPLWKEISNRYEHVVIINPNSRPKIESSHPDFYYSIQPYIWLDLGFYAVESGLTMNDFYFSREKDYSNYIVQLQDIITNTHFDPHTVYVFTDMPMWILAKINHREQDLIGLLDGLPVLLPGLASCTSCDLTGFQSKV
jgi:hypothetical protein